MAPHLSMVLTVFAEDYDSMLYTMSDNQIRKISLLPKLPFPDKSKIISAIGENPR
jgi:hypothetical protein